MKVQLAVSSDQLDTDFTIRLTDVYPDGRSMLLGEGIQRMRYRNGNSEADVSLLEPNEIYTIEIEFEELAITFLEGHQIRLIVSSSNYPRYNRNMNTGGEMYPNGEIDILVDPVIASNTIFSNANHISKLEMPLLDFDPALSNIERPIPNFEIFPNPASDHILITGINDRVEFRVIDLKGQTFKEGELGYSEELYVADLPVGIYWLQIKKPHSQWIGKELFNSEVTTYQFLRFSEYSSHCLPFGETYLSFSHGENSISWHCSNCDARYA